MKWNHSSLKGLRLTNEDHHTLPHKAQNKVFSFGIFDGHSTRLCKGDSVSLFLKNNLIKEMSKYPDKMNKISYIKNAHKIIDKKLKKHMKKYSRICGSTSIVVSIFRNRTIVISNVGDSRAILSRNFKPIILSTDHKPDNPIEKYRIEKMGGKIIFPKNSFNVPRINGMAVSRSFGDYENPYITYKPDIIKIKLKKTDNFIVIACDGLWDVMNNFDVINFVKKNKAKSKMAKLLANEALKRGSTDNVSVIFIYDFENTVWEN